MAKRSGQILSDRDTLQRIAKIIERYHRIPLSSNDSIPGSVMEAALELARGRDARRTGTYDFVDVVDEHSRFGWQVKSTKPGTPITWMRAKIRGAAERRRYSRTSANAAQEVGDELIALCNEHANKSFDLYEIDEIAYARLIVRPDKTATYFERPLLSRRSPTLFNPKDFSWRWTPERPPGSKEQQPSFGGYDRDGRRWFSWHSENQLHFNNEKTWWLPEGHPSRIDFRLSSQKIEPEVFLSWLESLEPEVHLA